MKLTTSLLVVHDSQCAPHVLDLDEIQAFCFDGSLTHLRLSDGTGLAILERPSVLVARIQELER